MAFGAGEDVRGAGEIVGALVDTVAGALVDVLGGACVVPFCALLNVAAVGDGRNETYDGVALRGGVLFGGVLLAGSTGCDEEEIG